MTISPELAAALPNPVVVDIPGRGRTTVWDSGPHGNAPTLVLLHGWNVDTRLNFGHAVDVLREEFRIIAFDLHGHGEGHRSPDPFRIVDCAADVVSVADQLGIDRFVPVGYSLGGAVAQMLADVAPERLDGMVLMATSATFRHTRFDTLQFAALRGVARVARRVTAIAPPRAQHAVFRLIVNTACRRYPSWVNNVVLTADMVRLLEAGAELGAFDSRSWLANVHIPTVVVRTTADRVVDPIRQQDLADLLPNADVVEIDADHRLPLGRDGRYGDILLEAARLAASG